MQKNLPDPREESIPELMWIGRMVTMMDNRFRIPGTSFRFGLDPIIGMIPFFGEVITFIISGLLVLTMARHGVSGKVIILMILNIAWDFLLGYIPIVGDTLDFFNRANLRNYALLKKHYHEKKHQGSGLWIILLILGILILVLVGLIYISVRLLYWVVEQVGDLLHLS